MRYLSVLVIGFVLCGCATIDGPLDLNAEEREALEKRSAQCWKEARWAEPGTERYRFETEKCRAIDEKIKQLR